MDSWINIELQTIAKGIDNWAPITIGDRIVATFTDTPIENEKAIRGNRYFFLGILNLQKGNKQINTIPILMAPNKIGGIDALIPSFAVG